MTERERGREREREGEGGGREGGRERERELPSSNQCHVIHPSSMVLLKVMDFGDVINDTDNISNGKLLHL